MEQTWLKKMIYDSGFLCQGNTNGLVMSQTCDFLSHTLKKPQQNPKTKYRPPPYLFFEKGACD